LFVCLFQTKDPVKFHDRHGVYITLSNDNKTAEKTTQSVNNGVVIVNTPMAVGELYEVMYTLENLCYYFISRIVIVSLKLNAFRGHLKD
jgi:hypothetical protein